MKRRKSTRLWSSRRILTDGVGWREESISVGKCYGLNCVSLEGILKFYSPKAVSMASFGNRVYRCNQVMMRLNWIRAGPNSITSVLIRSRVFGHRLGSEIWTLSWVEEKTIWRWRQRLEWSIYELKEHGGLPATTRSQKKQERILPQEPLQRTWLCWHLDFRLLASGTVREWISVVWATPLGAPCYSSPSRLTQVPWRTNGITHGCSEKRWRRTFTFIPRIFTWILIF